MKRFILASLLCTVATAGFGQGNSTDDVKIVCPSFDPAMWEHHSRDPLRNELISMTSDISDKTVLDIGAGSGYFTFGFAAHCKRVIATELDQRFLDYINEKEKSLTLTNVETLLANERQSELENLKDIDITLMVLVYHFLEDPKTFLTKVKAAMNKGGQIIIVNGDHFSPRFITDYLHATGFKQISIKKFRLAEGSCGPVTYNIVSARRP